MYMAIIEEGLGWKKRGGNGVSSGICNELEEFPSLREVRVKGFDRKQFVNGGAIVRVDKEVQLVVSIHRRSGRGYNNISIFILFAKNNLNNHP